MSGTILSWPGPAQAASAAAAAPSGNRAVTRRQPLDEVTAADFDEMIAVNLRAPFLLAQRALPGMADHGFGRVLFVSSVAAFTGGRPGRITPPRRPGGTG